MDLPRVRKQLITTLAPTGMPVTLHAYHMDEDLVERMYGCTDPPMPVFVTAGGEPVDRYGPGIYEIIETKCLLISIDPTAP